MNKRIIPRLEIKNNNMVKGINLEGLRVLGDPVFFAESYYNQGADEIFFQDIVASLYKRNSLNELISSLSSKIFVPLTVGGGIRSVNDINNVLKSGADKVSLNTTLFDNFNLLNIASKRFGSSTISVAMEVLKIDDDYICFTDNGRNNTNVKLIDWIKKVQDCGAGEISLTSIKHEGLRKGIDIKCIDKISNIVNVPLLIHGGIDSLETISSIFKNYNVSGVIISSILHYNFFTNDYITDKINQNLNTNINFFTCTINRIKDYLKEQNINVRS